MPAVCLEQHELEVLVDLQGYSGSFVHYRESKTPDCEDAPSDYCKGGLELDLGNLGANACATRTDFLALVRREEARHAECAQDADCALVSISRSCLGECPEAVVSADYADAMDALLEQAAEAYCADADCSLDSDCSGVEAACEDGRCALRAAGLSAP